MPPVGFEPTISAGERPQTNVLNSAATGTGFNTEYIYILQSTRKHQQGKVSNIIAQNSLTYFLLHIHDMRGAKSQVVKHSFM